MNNRIFLSHESAQAFWRSPAARHAVPCSIQPTKEDAPTAAAVRFARAVIYGASSPHKEPASQSISCIVASPACRRVIAHVVCHCRTRPVVCATIPPSSEDDEGVEVTSCASTAQNALFFQWDNNVFVSSVPYCFLQMARSLSFTELVEYGFEICGSFAIDSAVSESGASTASGAQEQRRIEASDDDASDRKLHLGFHPCGPLVPKDELIAFLSAQSGSRIAKKALSAAKMIIQGAASPYEVKLVLILCLPVSRGGFGMPRPLFNPKVFLDNRARKLTNAQHLRPDLLWPDQRVVVEYDSDLHTGSKKICDDAIRRNALQSMGYTVITVTKKQIQDANEMTRVARVVEQALHIHHRENRFTPSMKRASLWKELRLRS